MPGGFYAPVTPLKLKRFCLTPLCAGQNLFFCLSHRGYQLPAQLFYFSFEARAMLSFRSA